MAQKKTKGKRNAANSGRTSEPFDPAFGYKIWWLAIPTLDTHEVVSLLRLREIVESDDVRECIVSVYQQWQTSTLVFAIQPGWTLALFCNSGLRLEEIRQAIEPMSQRFGQAYKFSNVRTSDCYSWAKAVDGKLVRAFSYGDGTLFCNFGRRTREEVAAGLGIHSPDTFHDEDEGIEVASRWTVNPLEIKASQVLGPLLLGAK